MNSKQSSDSAQKGPGVGKFGTGVSNPSVPLPVSYGASGENATPGNRNAKR